MTPQVRLSRQHLHPREELAPSCSLPSQLLAVHLGERGRVTQVLAPAPARETRMQLLAPGFSLVQT